MKKFKKITALCLSLTLMLSFAIVNVNAEEATFETIKGLIEADPTRNISEEELLTPNGEVPVFDVNDIITEETIVLETSNNTRASGNSTGNKMTAAQYQQIEDVATKGNVIITKDSTTLGVQHGHSGIVYENCYSTVEALGYGEVSQWQLLSTWKNHYQVRLYYPSNVSENNRYAAGNYAYNNLRGWSYQVLPAVDSSSNLNCATLVWRAYKNGAGTTFTYNAAGTLIPQNIVEWWGMTQKVSVNWSGTAW